MSAGSLLRPAPRCPAMGVVAVALVAVVLAIWARTPAAAGPQHYGFGMSYLAAVERVGGGTRLAVYEGPLRAKPASWIPRWLDRSATFGSVMDGGIAIGNFWPGSFAKEYLVALSSGSGQLTARVLPPPECFSTAPWTVSSAATLPATTGTALACAAGDLRGTGKDQLLLLVQDGSSTKIAIFTAPSSATATNWTLASQATLPGVTGSVLGFACGDFWDENKDCIALATSIGGATRLTFYSYTSSSSSFSLITTDAAADLPVIAQNGLVAADYVKDGFDVLTMIPADSAADVQFRVAPLKPGGAVNPGPTYDGKALSRQWLPGAGGLSSKVVMTGTLGAAADSRVAFAAGRIFGYITTDLNSQFSLNTSRDAEIAFTHRTPVKGDRPPYGWPNTGEQVTYEINLKNNGSDTVPAGSAVVKVWINTPYRNADTDPATCDSPDLTLPVSSAIPAFDSNNLAASYVKLTAATPWPYGLTPVAATGNWMKCNFEQVGERWLVVSLDCQGDTNARNNRYEAALNGLTLHPIFRNNASLADRGPTVQGDPCSKEYLSRKLADSVLCIFERSGTTTNEDVLQRPFFDGYELGWPDDLAEPQRSQKWAEIQDDYEGWRELDGWWGIYQGWERFNWGDGGAELHETAHLFQNLGDLYQYYAFPVWTGAARMADGAPVQLMTYAWGPDSFGTGHAMLGLPLCELVKPTIGARNTTIEAWWQLVPDNVFVRVLDRDGSPVAGAQVTLTPYRSTSQPVSGTTGADGRWDTGLPSVGFTTDDYGRRHYADDFLNNDLVATVRIGSYQDCAIVGAEDVCAYGHIAGMYRSFVNPNEWTWDFRTNYKSAAPEPAFVIEGAVKGSSVQLGITGAADAVYRLYRRWEPAYVRTFVGSYAASGTKLTVSQDMAAADSHRSGRFRAIYEVTEVTAGGESLPRVISVTGLNTGRGVSTRSDRKLLVAANSGIANPFCILFEGVTPYQEFFYHFRFGHTANKVVESVTTPGKYYATLSFSDMTPEYRFDMVVPSDTGYDVRNDIGGFQAISYTTASPYTIRLPNATTASSFKPGDGVSYGDTSAIVQSISGDTLTLSAAIFPAGLGSPWFSGSRLAGRPGNNAALRELSNPRGLAVIEQNGKEYVVIADTDNRRVVVWDDATGYIAHWQAADTLAKPTAVAAHPLQKGKFFAIFRRTDYQSKLCLFTFNGTSVTLDSGYPVTVSAGHYTSVYEMGLAAALDPSSGGIVLAVTDATANKVVELRQSGSTWPVMATYTQATGTYAGSSALGRTSDVAYVQTGTGLSLYAVDGTDRLVTLTQRAFTPVSFGGAKALADGTLTAVKGAVGACFAGLTQFYIQDPLRTGGIQIRPYSEMPAVGQEVAVICTMATDPGTHERYATALSWSPTETAYDPAPLGMNAGALGGGQAGLQEGVAGGRGTNNVGLLVRLAGVITGVAPDRSWAYLSDGCGLNDGNSYGWQGALIDLTAISAETRPVINAGDGVAVTGISGMYGLDGGYHRCVRARYPSDISNYSKVTWSVINGPVSEASSVFNHIGTDGASLYVVFQNNQFWRYSFAAASPTSGIWTQLATPSRTVNGPNSNSDLAYQAGYLYTSAVLGTNRTILRYSISSNAWEVWQSAGSDITSCKTTGNGLFMHPSLAGVGYSASQVQGKWVSFDWSAKTSSNSWMSTSALGVTDAGWVSRNEDVAIGSGVYYSTKNDKTAGLSGGDIICGWNTLAGPVPSVVVAKPWQCGFAQSIEFVPGDASPSGHDELWLVRGSDGSTSPGDGWGYPTSDWARLDLADVAGGWRLAQLPGPVYYNTELVLVGATAFVRAEGASWYVSCPD